MLKEYDKIIKETLRDVVDVLLRKVIGLDVVECTQKNKYQGFEEL